MAKATETRRTVTTRMVNEFLEVLSANDSSRLKLSRLLSGEGDSLRDYYAECQIIKEPSAEQYWDWFRNDPIANKVVNLFPKHSWQVQPLVYEDQDGEEATEFEEAWDALDKGLRVEESYRSQEAGSMLYEYLYRLDQLSGVGRYGVMVLGLDDIKEGEIGGLAKPAKMREGGKVRTKLLYLRVFPESLAKVTKWDNEDGSPRNGQPLIYSVTFNDMSQIGSTGTGSPTSTTKDVHWTRVIHVAEGLASGETFGTERMRAVKAEIQDLFKIRRASPEGYWKSCINILAVETNPLLGGDVDVDESAMKDNMEALMEGLKRYGLFKGTSLKGVGPSIVDPSPHITQLIQAICIQLHCPLRIFMGSERGELASSQDDDAWNDMVKQRNTSHVTPRILSAFVDRLINLGVLPAPKSKDGYTVEWPDVASHSAQDRATVASTLVTAMAAYANAGLDQLITWTDLLTQVIGLTDEQAHSITENARKAMEGEDGTTSHMLGMATGVTALLQMFTMAKAGEVSEDQLRQMLVTVFKFTEEMADNLIADGIEVTPPTPTTLPHGAKTGTDPNLPGPIVKLPKPPLPKALPGGKKPTTNELMWDMVNECELTVNAKAKLTGGHWITTDGGSHVYMKGGKPIAGNPKVIAKMKGGKKTIKPKPDAAVPKTQKKAAEKKEAPKAKEDHHPKKKETHDTKAASDHGLHDVGTTPEGKHRDHLNRVINDHDVLKDLKIPEHMYHITSRENLESIKKDGLTFGGPRATKDGEIRGAYLSWSKDPKDIIKAGGDFNLKDTVVIKVSTKGLDLKLDPEYFDGSTKQDAKRWVDDINNDAADWAAYSPKKIDAKHLRFD